MAYKESVYVKAKDILAARRNSALTQREARHSAAVAKCPEIIALEREMANYASQMVKAFALNENAKEYVEGIKHKSLEAQSRRKQLLKTAGFPEDYLETNFTCPFCSDTGYHDGYICSCYTELLKKIARQELNASGQIEKCTFQTFNVNFYPDTVDGTLGISQREHMQNVLDFCKRWVRSFSKEKNGIFFYGKTGLGKTHLSLAIANEIIDRGYNVHYGSVQNIFNILEANRFGRGERFDEENDIYNCDLLILDDLGSEFSTQFTVSLLYNVINTRLINSKPIIISTNLNLHEIEEKYTERLSSRIIGSMTPVTFCGRDIRQIKTRKNAN